MSVRVVPGMKILQIVNVDNSYKYTDLTTFVF